MTLQDKCNKSCFVGVFVGLAFLLLSFHAVALVLGPQAADKRKDEHTYLGTLADINDAFDTAYRDLELLWKGETDEGPDGGDGSLIHSYHWKAGSSADGGVIEHVPGKTAASCNTCILVVKSGGRDDVQYLFDLGRWDGVETIRLSEFWHCSNEVISDVAIWGGSSRSVSEPGYLILLGLGLGLLGLVYGRRCGKL